jgi:hypothetical protein
MGNGNLEGVAGTGTGDRAQRDTVGLITRRSAVQICPPLLVSSNSLDRSKTREESAAAGAPTELGSVLAQPATLSHPDGRESGYLGRCTPREFRARAAVVVWGLAALVGLALGGCDYEMRECARTCGARGVESFSHEQVGAGCGSQIKPVCLCGTQVTVADGSIEETESPEEHRCVVLCNRIGKGRSRWTASREECLCGDFVAVGVPIRWASPDGGLSSDRVRIVGSPDAGSAR